SIFGQPSLGFGSLHSRLNADPGACLCSAPLLDLRREGPVRLSYWLVPNNGNLRVTALMARGGRKSQKLNSKAASIPGRAVALSRTSPAPPLLPAPKPCSPDRD